MKRETYLKKCRERRKKVVFLHDEKGLTFEQIGKRLKVTRQQAYNLYKAEKTHEKENS